jgi:hypothetical protein
MTNDTTINDTMTAKEMVAAIRAMKGAGSTDVLDAEHDVIMQQCRKEMASAITRDLPGKDQTTIVEAAAFAMGFRRAVAWEIYRENWRVLARELPAPAWVAEMNEQFAVSMYDGLAWRADEPDGGLATKYTKLSPGRFSTMFANKRIDAFDPISGKIKNMSKSKAWMKHPARKDIWEGVR